MPSDLDVYLSGEPVATLEYRGPSDYRLIYESDWLGRDDAIPVSYSLPLSDPIHHGDRVLDFVDNLLPDGEGVRDRWAIEAGLDRGEPFDLLAAYGRDVAGALEFYPAFMPRDESRSSIRVTHAQIATRIAAIRRDDDSWNDPTTATGRFSLGGAQGKFALARSGDGWVEPSGVEPTTHIFKPQVRGYDDGELIEAIIMIAASILGLETAVAVIDRFAGERSLVVRRFDRVAIGGAMVRVHQEDLCQALGLPRLRKYETHGGPSFRSVLRLLDEVCSRTEIAESKQRYLESLFFSWLVLNTDAHAKNYSLQVGTDGARLSPLYDMSSLIPYLPDDREGGLRSAIARTSLSTRLVQSYGVADMGWIEWRGAATEAGVPADDFLDWCTAVIDGVESIVAVAAAQVALPGESGAVERLIARMGERVELARRQMRAPRV